MATVKPWQVISPQDYIASQQNKNKPEPKAKPTDKGVRGEVGLLKTILPKISQDLGFIRKSISSLVKSQESDKKAAYFERTKRRVEEYAAKYKKAKPTPTEKKIIKQDKSFMEQLKEGLQAILKFVLIGLGTIGLSKLLSAPGVTGGLQTFLEKVILAISDVIQKALSVITPIFKDPNIVDSLTQLVKKVFTFIADGISAAANVIKKILTDPENKENIGKVIVGVISTVFTGLMTVLDIAGKALSENKESIKEGIVTVFVKIAEALAGALGFVTELVKDPAFSQAIADIFVAIKGLITELLNIEIPVPLVGSVTLGKLLAIVAGSLVAFEIAMAAFTGYLMTKIVGGALGGKVGKKLSPAEAATAAKEQALGERVKGLMTSPGTTAALAGGALAIQGAKSVMGGGTPDYYQPSTPTSPVKTGTEGSASTQQKGSAVSTAKEFAGKGGADFIASMEGFAGKAYLDPPGNNKNQYSVGYGHLITEAEVKQGFINLGNGKKIEVKGPGGKDTVVSKEEAKALLNSDLPKYEAVASRAIGADAWEKLNQDQKNALTSLAYNGGAGQMNYLVKNGLRDAILKGDMEGASKIIYEKGFKMSGGKLLAGLDTRRLKEATLFAGAGSAAPSQMAAAPPPPLAPAADSAGTSPTAQTQPPAQEAPKEEPSIVGKALETLLTGGGDFLKQIDQMTGGKLGVASGDLAKAFRTRNIFENPSMVDSSTNIVADSSTQESGPIPGVIDENLLKRLT
jgi:GH24 family phage-related lysozyme (muramidase)